MQPSKSRARTVAAWALVLALSAIPSFAQAASDQKQLNLASFETIWTTIRDKHWQTTPGGLDWQAIHEEFRPRVEGAPSIEAARGVMREMLARLNQTHFAIFPSPLYQDLETIGGGDGWPGFDTRILDGRVIVTEGFEPGLFQLGWEVVTAGGADLRAVVQKLAADPGIHELQRERAVAARLSGPVGAVRRFEFSDANGSRVTRDIKLLPPRGEPSAFGNLPPQYVWFESKRLGDAGYIRFNLFLDLVRLMPAFGEAVQQCARCSGIVIDLRGNVGGIGAMAMGMAGFLVDKPGERLGTMQMRSATLNFIINPRAGAYGGPVAILIDGSSASTTEIFAGGLKDLGRARIFGTRSAGAALPSVITRLPNGDGFQYAIANYISQAGQPLEGNGVTPDTEVRLTRESLLAGYDAVLEAALDWIRKQKDQR